jgi:hypothetical protein
MTDPGANGVPGRFGNLKLHGALGLLLQHDSSRCHDSTNADNPHPELYEVTGPKFAVDGQVEQGQFSAPSSELQPNANYPNLLELDRRLLTYELALVPRWSNGRRAFS